MMTLMMARARRLIFLLATTASAALWSSAASAALMSSAAPASFADSSAPGAPDGAGGDASPDPELVWKLAEDPRPSVRVGLLANFIVLFPHHERTPAAITEILDESRRLPCPLALRYLDDVARVLAVNPVRPVWHVDVARAETRFAPGAGLEPSCPTANPLVYVKLLYRIIDETRPDDFYLHHPYDAELARTVPGLDIPVFKRWDAAFLRAVPNKVDGEPIHAQILRAIASTYEELGMWPEAKLAYEQYLRAYFPQWDSLSIMARLARHDDYVRHRQAGMRVGEILEMWGAGLFGPEAPQF